MGYALTTAWDEGDGCVAAAAAAGPDSADPAHDDDSAPHSSSAQQQAGSSKVRALQVSLSGCLGGTGGSVLSACVVPLPGAVVSQLLFCIILSILVAHVLLAAAKCHCVFLMVRVSVCFVRLWPTTNRS